MNKLGPVMPSSSIVTLAVLLLCGGVAFAQTNTPPPPTAPASPQATTPNAETPPGGIARGVIPPTHDVDPEIVTKPPAAVTPMMPVIKPPTNAR